MQNYEHPRNRSSSLTRFHSCCRLRVYTRILCFSYKACYAYLLCMDTPNMTFSVQTGNKYAKFCFNSIREESTLREECAVFEPYTRERSKILPSYKQVPPSATYPPLRSTMLRVVTALLVIASASAFAPTGSFPSPLPSPLNLSHSRRMPGSFFVGRRESYVAILMRVIACHFCEITCLGALEVLGESDCQTAASAFHSVSERGCKCFGCN